MRRRVDHYTLTTNPPVKSELASEACPRCGHRYHKRTPCEVLSVRRIVIDKEAGEATLMISPTTEDLEEAIRAWVATGSGLDADTRM